MRKLRRLIAHRKMERAGLHKVNKYGFFKNKWREWAKKDIKEIDKKYK